jgi:hypothetical protein
LSKISLGFPGTNKYDLSLVLSHHDHSSQCAVFVVLGDRLPHSSDDQEKDDHDEDTKKEREEEDEVDSFMVSNISLVYHG